MKKASLLFLLLLGASACVKDRIFDSSSGPPPPAGISAGVVKVNELVATGSTLMNEFGVASDWFEIYNPSSAAFTMDSAKWYFTDNASLPVQYQLKKNITLPPYGFEVIFCDHMDTAAVATQVHANFNLSSAGESVVINYNDGNSALTIDSYTFPAQTAGTSTGRFPDGSSTWNSALVPTPGASNHP